MASLNDEILIGDLEENLDDDPYGTATFVIRNVIHRALNRYDSMNEAERDNLVALEESLRARDNA